MNYKAKESHKINTILFDVVNEKENLSFLQKIPYIKIESLAVFFYFSDTRSLLTHDVLKNSKFNLDDIFKIAKTNMENRHPTTEHIKFSKVDRTPLFCRIYNDSRHGITSFFTDKANDKIKRFSSKNKVYFFFVSDREAICVNPDTFTKEEANILLNSMQKTLLIDNGPVVSTDLFEYNIQTKKITKAYEEHIPEKTHSRVGKMITIPAEKQESTFEEELEL